MFLRFRAFTAAIFCLLPPASSHLFAQASTPDAATIAHRKHEILLDLQEAGVEFPPNDTGEDPSFQSLVSPVREWASKPQSPKPPPPKPPLVPDLDRAMGGTFPNRRERWLRFHQFKVEGTEQPATVLAYASPTATSPTQIVNPDHVLFKYTLSAKASEFFPTTQDVADQAKAFLDAGGVKVSRYTQMLCRSPNPFVGPVQFQTAHPKPRYDDVASCLSKTRKRDIFYRFVSGFAGTFSFSDNPEIVQNIDLRIDPTASNRVLYSGEVMFDPVNVFLTGTDWKNAASASEAYNDDVRESVRRKMRDRCPWIGTQSFNVKQCLSRLSGPTGWGRFAAMALPTGDYKVQTQFDFIKNGAAFQAPITPFGHLYSFSLSQDFKKAFATGKQRDDALAAITAYYKQAKNKDPRLELLDAFKSLAMDANEYIKNTKLYTDFLGKIAAVL